MSILRLIPGGGVVDVDFVGTRLISGIGYVTGRAAGVTAALSGTATISITETDITAGGKTSIITLTGDTWVAAGTGAVGSIADTQAIIDGFDSVQSEPNGWNIRVRDAEVVGSVVRTSDTVVTITWTAAASYDITAQETITCTVPAATMVTSGIDVIAIPIFTVDFVASGGVEILRRRIMEGMR